MAGMKDKKTFFKTKKTEKVGEFEQVQEVENKEEEQKQEIEQTMWSVRVGPQTLYKVYLDGRTRLDNMSAEENKKVAEILGPAIEAVAKILKDRTTQHVAKRTEEITESGPTPVGEPPSL